MATVHAIASANIVQIHNISPVSTKSNPYTILPDPTSTLSNLDLPTLPPIVQSSSLPLPNLIPFGLNAFVITHDAPACANYRHLYITNSLIHEIAFIHLANKTDF